MRVLINLRIQGLRNEKIKTVKIKDEKMYRF